MNFFKKLIAATTGYWIYKLDMLPVGADLFVDISRKINYPEIQTVFDVGANVGQTHHYFRYYLPAARIYCFEPITESFTQLQKATAADKNCCIEKMALGDTAGEKRIKVFEGDMGVLNSLNEHMMNQQQGAREEVIRIDTLDAYCREHGIDTIDLLKIDTEGYEINVLKGAAHLLEQGRVSFVYCETGFQQKNTRNTYFGDLNTFLNDKGYWFFGFYQTGYHDWIRGNGFSNALFVHPSVFPVS